MARLEAAEAHSAAAPWAGKAEIKKLEVDTAKSKVATAADLRPAPGARKRISQHLGARFRDAQMGLLCVPWAVKDGGLRTLVGQGNA